MLRRLNNAISLTVLPLPRLTAYWLLQQMYLAIIQFATESCFLFLPLHCCILYFSLSLRLSFQEGKRMRRVWSPVASHSTGVAGGWASVIVPACDQQVGLSLHIKTELPFSVCDRHFVQQHVGTSRIWQTTKDFLVRWIQTLELELWSWLRFISIIAIFLMFFWPCIMNWLYINYQLLCTDYYLFIKY